MHQRTKIRLRFTPDGVVLERCENDRRVASGTYPEIDTALAGVRIQLEAEERAYLHPGRTDMQVELEQLARAIEEKLS